MKKIRLWIAFLLITGALFQLTGCSHEVLSEKKSSAFEPVPVSTPEITLSISVISPPDPAPAATPANTPADASSIPAGEKQTVLHTGATEFKFGFFIGSAVELEECSAAVVKATVIDSRPNSGANDTEAVTVTTIRIDDVLKPDNALQKGQNATLVEYYRTEDDPAGNTLHVYSADGSLPLKKNQQYLLFLSKSPQADGSYAVTGAWQGKYPLTEKTKTANFSELTAADLEFPEKYTTNMLWSLAREVFEKYVK